jgi:hypothetical protein
VIYRNCLRVCILLYCMEGKVHHRTGCESPEGIVISALNTGRWLRPRLGRFTSGNEPGTIVQDTGWAPGTIWMGAEYVACIAVLSSGRPARCESLYRLSYPVPPQDNPRKLGISENEYLYFYGTICHRVLCLPLLAFLRIDADVKGAMCYLTEM